ncbi:hypothetical protein GCM10009863_44340 [Streptomyces axinellae]|uniref:Uncharacterized protein n=1 Tax=Streptomyces axinellae TaxID=552788 RepID=A0ABP6CVZ1_9ACTN
MRGSGVAEFPPGIPRFLRLIVGHLAPTSHVEMRVGRPVSGGGEETNSRTGVVPEPVSAGRAGPYRRAAHPRAGAAPRAVSV